MMHTIFKYTGGHPLYLTEYIRALYDVGFLRDDQGAWSDKVVQDLSVQIEALDVHEFIKNHLDYKYAQADLSENQKNLLLMMALVGKPTLRDLNDMTGGAQIEEDLEGLKDQGFLRHDVHQHFILPNVLFKDVILKNAHEDHVAELCDVIADHFESHQNDLQMVAHYRGRGRSPERFSILLDLSREQKMNFDFLNALENAFLVFEAAEDLNLKYSAALRIAETYMDQGRFVKAQEFLESHPIGKDFEFLEYWAVMQIDLALCYKYQEQWSRAENCYQEAMQAVENHAPLKWLWVRLTNLLARLKLDQGFLDESEKLFLQAWPVWHHELSDDDQVKAIRTDIDLLYHARGDYEQAIFYLHEVLEVLNHHTHHVAYPLAICKLARNHLKLGEMNRAEHELKTCLNLIQDRKAPYWIYIVYNDLGNVYDMKRDYTQAISCYEHAYDLVKKLSLSDCGYVTAYNLGQCHLKTHQLAEALKYFNFAKSFLESQDLSQDYSMAVNYHSTLLGLAGVYRRQQAYDDVKTYLNQAQSFEEQHDFLKPHRLYRLYETAHLARAQGRREDLEDFLKDIETYVDQPGFLREDYELFLNELNAPSSVPHS